MEIGLIELNKTFEDYKALFKYVSDSLLEKKLVKDSFYKGLLDREGYYPTGLLMDNSYGIAIPHTDIEHVIKNNVSIITLKDPLEFNNMDGSIEKVKVRLAIVLAFKDSDGHIKFLEKLFNLISDGDLVKKIIECEDKREVERIFEELIKDMNRR